MAQAFVSLFVIIDPIGNILIFYLYSQAFRLGDRLSAAAIAVLAAFLMLLAFSLGGQEALTFLGISEPSFSIAAGLLLLPPAYRLIMEGEPATTDADRSLKPLDFALVPLATPLIAGPGALAATTQFASTIGVLETTVAMTLVLVITFVAFALSGWLFRVLGEAFLKLASRIVGIVLFAIAVDFIVSGVEVVLNG